ncbi:hypothetical protein Rrhod_0629 [Rhodococcus rhodnii LMG 5362]|uniref:Uncharacterized protein n=1 Tax=Rhodococcus rhodnii LMG 5362 TaxID=1273125 RepID=R7WRP9_9NOCA|nr:hypothetical protein Rrhod_0629 [Rhodococcus rhodnii LMG 5362]
MVPQVTTTASIRQNRSPSVTRFTVRSAWHGPIFRTAPVRTRTMGRVRRRNPANTRADAADSRS